jgi:PAS domain S-box-containing protein
LDELKYVAELMARAPVLAFAKDRDGRYLYVNRAWLELTGLTSEQVLGRTDHELFPEEFADGYVRNDRRVLETGETIDVEEIAEVEGKRSVVGYSTKFPLKEPDGTIYAVGGIVVDITERHAAQEALRRSEAGYRDLIEHSPDAYLMLDPRAGKFVELNENACRLFKYSKDELLKMGPADLSPPTQADGRSSSAAAMQYVGDALAGNTPVFDWIHQAGDGELLPVRIWLARVEVQSGFHVRASILDMREIERVRSVLERTRAQLDAVQDSLPQLVAVYDPVRRTLVHCNRTYRRVLGDPPAHHLWEIAHHACERAAREGNARQEHALRVADGSSRAFQVDVSVFHRDASGKATRLLLVASDVTEQRELDAQLRQARRLESLGRLAGGVAHDFNNLLTVILGSADFLESAVENDSQARHDLGALKDAAQQAQSLTNQLLAFAKADQGEVKSVNVDALVSGSLRVLDRLIGEHVRVELALGAAGQRVLIDEGQLMQIVFNLSVNARDAMPRGGVLRIESRVACLPQSGAPALPSGSYLEVSFTDTGAGMAPEVVDKAFEPFFSTKSREEGTGLGLSTVFGIVQRARGQVTLESTPGEGTRVALWFPLMEQRHSTLPPQVTPGPGHAGGRILLVEDDRSVRAVSERALRVAGYDVTAVEHPERALALVDSEQRFDLVVSDVVMPGMSGLRLAEELRERIGDVPVLFVSGYAEEALREHGIDASAVELLGKPFLPSDLVERVGLLMRRSR